MHIEKNYDLTKLNTLGVKANTSFFVELNSEQDLLELFKTREFKENKKIFLGGGSNILFTKDFEGIVVLNKLKGIQILNTDKKKGDDVFIRCMSGEVWHDLVLFTVDQGLWGIENLAFIPGTVGGAPVQNIGAYGVELKDTLHSVEVYKISDGSKKVFLKDECEFGYRDSIFKNKFKGEYFISAITLSLSKHSKPNLSYKILADYINDKKIEVYNPKDISDAVTAIRTSKLPDPCVIGNAGSFFKNVFVDEEKFKELKEKYSDIKFFEEDGIKKIPAAWLIESCGTKEGESWKGYRLGNVGVHAKHALILVNYGNGTGQEIKDLAEQIMDSVYSKFGLKLTPEVNLI